MKLHVNSKVGLKDACEMKTWRKKASSDLIKLKLVWSYDENRAMLYHISPSYVHHSQPVISTGDNSSQIQPTVLLKGEIGLLFKRHFH